MKARIRGTAPLPRIAYTMGHDFPLAAHDVLCVDSATAQGNARARPRGVRSGMCPHGSRQGLGR